MCGRLFNEFSDICLTYYRVHPLGDTESMVPFEGDDDDDRILKEQFENCIGHQVIFHLAQLPGMSIK